MFDLVRTLVLSGRLAKAGRAGMRSWILETNDHLVMHETTWKLTRACTNL